MLIKFRIAIYLLLVFYLSACTDMPKRWDPQSYTVKKGDTLYAIAWRYEKDFRQVADWNNIHAPYAIYPGQRLVMQAANKDGTLSKEERPQVLVESSTGKAVSSQVIDASTESSKSDVKKTQVVVQKYDTLFAISRREGYSHHQLARWNHLKPPYMLRPGQKLRLSPPAAALGSRDSKPSSAKNSIPEKVVTRPLVSQPIVAKPINAKPIALAKPGPVKPSKSLPTRVAQWSWPARGKVVKRFKASDTARKGIGIQGSHGAPVNAAAGGTVVYSGNGLINYGNLIIIKHSHSFLSAYAYNKLLLVKEGESVKPGQVIAKMGKTDRGKPRLHFEIRRNGKPVNPLHYLPKS